MGRPKGSKNKPKDEVKVLSKEKIRKNLTKFYIGNLKHIVLYSGGLGSYFTAKRLIEQGIPKEDIILLFTDTKFEDPDLYRFLKESTEKLGIPLTDHSDGRDIWQVFKDHRFLSNSRVDHCSGDLKRRMSRKFIKKFNPENCIIYLGFDWTEMHRYEKAVKAWLPYIVKSPMCDAPYLDKEDMKRILVEEDKIELPYLYKMGLSHNNCSGFCVKAGIGHYIQVLKAMPERYKEFEEKEEEIRRFIGKDVSILRRTRNGVRTNITLRELREEYERNQVTEEELCEIGGCGCFQK